MQKERPILFSAPMVRAILEGRKTQTRRVVKPQPTSADPEHNYFIVQRPGRPFLELSCPYGQPGDQEWRTGPIPETGWYYVRGLLAPSVGGDDRPVWVDPKYFTFGFSERDDPEAIGLDTNITPKNVQWKRPGDRLWVKETTVNVEAHGFIGPVYLQSEAGAAYLQWGLGPDPVEVEPEDLKLRPSLFMTRKMSRITLEVTAVRVERLQDISEADAKAEGTELLHEYLPGKVGFNYRQAYGGLWESINGPGSWGANPWVWVVEFKRINQWPSPKN